MSPVPDSRAIPPAWRWSLTLPRFVYTGVGLAFSLMVVGHLQINGQVFDQITGEYYNVFSRWISDYAAKAPEGWWIKGGIFSFSGALLLMMGGLSRKEAVSPRGVARAFFLQCTTACMVGGLVLVAIFDISPSQFEVVEKNLLLEAATRERSPAAAVTPAAATGKNNNEKNADPSSETGPVQSLLELINPEGASLREELLRERKAMDEDDRAMLDYFREMNWDHTQVIDFLKARYLAREEEEAAKKDKAGKDAPAAAAPPLREIRRLPQPERHVAQAYYHRMGFHLFLSGFVLCSIYMTRVEWNERRYDRLPGTFLTLLLTLIFSGWLFFEQQRLAGIPQRALLVLIAVWLLRLVYRLPAPGQQTPQNAAISS